MESLECLHSIDPRDSEDSRDTRLAIKRALCSALYSIKTALYSIKTALYSIKTALYSIKRALYSIDRALGTPLMTLTTDVWTYGHACIVTYSLMARVETGELTEGLISWEDSQGLSEFSNPRILGHPQLVFNKNSTLQKRKRECHGAKFICRVIGGRKRGTCVTSAVIQIIVQRWTLSSCN